MKKKQKKTFTADTLTCQSRKAYCLFWIIVVWEKFNSISIFCAHLQIYASTSTVIGTGLRPFLHQSHFHVRSWQPLGHHYSFAFTASWHCNEYLFLRYDNVKVNSACCSVGPISHTHTNKLTPWKIYCFVLVPVAIPTHNMKSQENANSLTHTATRSPKRTYCVCVWCVWGWRDLAGGRGRAFAAVLQ